MRHSLNHGAALTCSSISTARFSMDLFHDVNSTMRSCHARTCGRPSQTSSQGCTRTSLRRKFHGTKAMSAKVILSPTLVVFVGHLL